MQYSQCSQYPQIGSQQITPTNTTVNSVQDINLFKVYCPCVKELFNNSPKWLSHNLSTLIGQHTNIHSYFAKKLYKHFYNELDYIVSYYHRCNFPINGDFNWTYG